MTRITSRFASTTLLGLVVALPAAAELGIETLEAIHPAGQRDGYEDMEYRFPQVAGDSATALQINTYLQAVELQKLPGRYEEAPFEAIWPGMDPPFVGTTGVSYSVKSNRPGFLSLDLYYSYMGAYPSGGLRSYNFDARTGAPIDLQRIFTPKGLALLRDHVVQSRLQRIDDFLAGKAVDEYGTQLSSDPEIAADQTRLYNECRTFVAEDSITGNDLGLRDNALTLSRDSCAAHSQLAIADLGNFDSELPYDTLKPWLNTYGLCLLVEQRADCKSIGSGIEAGVYRGNINDRYPITLVVEGSDPQGSLSAMYFYDRFAQRIALAATRQEDGSVLLVESGPPPATFALRWVDGAIEGTWTQEGKPPLPVTLK